MSIRRKPKFITDEMREEVYTKDFFDMILPPSIIFKSKYYILGDSYRCVWAVVNYPPETGEQALLAKVSDKNGVTVHIYNNPIDPIVLDRIVRNADRKYRFMSEGSQIRESIEARGRHEDLETMLSGTARNREIFLNCSVFIELKADSLKALKSLQNEIGMELARAKIEVSRLTMLQKEGFLSVDPLGRNMFGSLFERVLPVSSAANLFPLSYSGKADKNGLYIGKDKFGSSIFTDFDLRSDDRTNSNVLILGNSGQGKSYLLKLLLTNIRESGKSVIVLDPEEEYKELTSALGGCYLDFMNGEYKINPLEPKDWGNRDDTEEYSPQTFKRVTRLSQHIAFLKDFFRTCKEFTDEQLDTIEIILTKLYKRFGIDDFTDFEKLSSDSYPILSDLYDLCEEEYKTFDDKADNVFTQDTLRQVCLGLFSMCRGAASKYFNGQTNISDDKFLCFGVKGLLEANQRLKDAMLFNILSYMSSKLLGTGNTAASIDEMYLFLTNKTAIEYIRNAMKRVRKKDSAVLLASQNVDDFLLPEVREMTKPLFSIPTHQFLFYPGNVNVRDICDALTLEAHEYDLIKSSSRGTCLYRCGNERYLLEVKAPDHKSKLFGSAGGR